MKVKNLNNSSLKTEKLIRDTFIQMCSEKRELSKITVCELVKRADISRAAFYSHYDDIYGVVAGFEEELISNFFTNAKLLATDDFEKFFEAFFAFLKANDNNYKMLCKSNDVLMSAGRLTRLAVNKFMELVDGDPDIINKENIELDVSILIDGIFAQYIKYCRGTSPITPDDLQRAAEKWYERFMKDHYAFAE